MKILIHLLLGAAVLALGACSGERYTELMNASRDGSDKAVLRAIQEHNAEVNQRSSQGKTALMLAASKGHLDTVKLLIQHGADVNIADNYGSTAIIVAATAGKTEIVEELLQYGANPTERDSSGGSALDNAVFFGHHDSVKVLLKHVDKLDPEMASEILLYSVGRGNQAIADLLLDYGIDINIRGKKQRTALIVAAAFNQKKIAQELLKRGADKNLKDINGNTALAIAQQEGNKEIAKLLQ